VEQLLAHLIGDYVLQSDRMAQWKRSSWAWATLHGAAYTLPFALFFRPSLLALCIICFTHVVIDRLRLARYIIVAKNWLCDRRGDFATQTGFPVGTPSGLATALFIVVDNTMHLAINYAALRWT
jgi:hypothetical protein